MPSKSSRVVAILLINAVAVIAACYMFEVAAVIMRPRWFSNVMVNSVPDGVKPGAYDRRSPMAVVVETRKVEGPSVYPLPTRPVLAQLFRDAKATRPHSVRPLAGVSNTPTILCAETAHYQRYHSDRFGFNNVDSVWDHPATIAFVGDSFVQGNCVSADSTIAAVMRRDGVHAISLGVSGNGPVSELATMREFAPRTQARMIGWMFYEGNDLCDLDEELRDSMLTKYLAKAAFTQGLVNRQADVDSLLREGYDRQLARLDNIYHGRTWSLRNVIGLGQLRTVFVDRIRRPQQAESACANLAELRRVLERARDDAALTGVDLTFIYLPSSVLPNTPAHVRLRGRRAAVLSAARDIGLRTIDMTSELTSDSIAGRVWNFPASHYSAFGYERVARAIERELTLVPF
jgi:hypothetical protein